MDGWGKEGLREGWIMKAGKDGCVDGWWGRGGTEVREN